MENLAFFCPHPNLKRKSRGKKADMLQICPFWRFFFGRKSWLVKKFTLPDTVKNRENLIKYVFNFIFFFKDIRLKAKRSQISWMQFFSLGKKKSFLNHVKKIQAGHWRMFITLLKINHKKGIFNILFGKMVIAGNIPN